MAAVFLAAVFLAAVFLAAVFLAAAFTAAGSVAEALVTEASEATDFGLVGFSEAFVPATMAAITLAITDTAPAI
jgi:hypothetical protein